MSILREAFGLPAKREKRGLIAGTRSLQSYVAAGTSRLTADFNGSGGSADSELLGSLERMRNRARYLERNEPLVRRYFDLMRINVIGRTGMKLQVKALNDRSGDLDTAGNAMVENAWKEFCSYGNCSADGQHTMKSMSALALNTALRDGEAFFQVVRGRRFKHGIALNPFEPDLIDDGKNLRLKNGNRVRMGVEIDQYGRPVAYHVRQSHPGDTEFSAYSLAKERRVPADDIIHVKLVRRAGQTRGEPTLVPVITTFKMINGHREAELVAARIAASKMGFFTSEEGDEFPADGEAEADAPITNVEPGTLWQLPPGMQFSEFNPSHPSTAFADFQKNVLMSVASGMNVSYEALTGDVSGVSYSSLRQVAISERDYFGEVQDWFKDQFMLRVFGIWLQHVMDFNYIPLPPSRFDKFFNAATFRSRGWKWVDPAKEVSAATEAIHSGLLSLTEASDQMGYDLDETFAQIQREKELAQSMDITLAFEPFGAKPGSKADQMSPEGEEPDGGDE